MFLISAQGGTPEEILSEKDSQLDPQWSPDGKKMIFGRPFWIPPSSGKFTLQILDLHSKQVSTLPGSEDLFAPRWSPDGLHLAALSIDMKKLLLFDFKTQKWMDWVTDAGGILFPVWSRDSKYVYYNYAVKQDSGYSRIKIGQTRPEFLFSLKDLRRFGDYSGLTPDGLGLFTRNVSMFEIYSVELELP